MQLYLYAPKLWCKSVTKDDEPLLLSPTRTYICAVDCIFVKRSEDPASSQIVKLKREVGAPVSTTGRTWTGPSGGIWAELQASEEGRHAGWCLVQGPGFGVDGPALIDPNKTPKCFVFDLDSCTWTPGLEMLPKGTAGPWVYDAQDNTCTAANGEVVRILGDLPAIWHAILTEPSFCGARIAIASCCSEPIWANEILGLFEVGKGKKMRDCVSHTEIHRGSKQDHLREISEALGIPPRDIVFFDDLAMWCQDVMELGTVCVEVPEGGVTYAALNLALVEYERQRS